MARQRAFDFTQYGWHDLVILSDLEMSIVYTAARELYDRHSTGPALEAYILSAADDLRDQAEHGQVNDDWITRALINMAVQGLMGRAIPDCIDIED